MPIRKTGSLPENIDRQVNEIIRAYREVEEKVNRLQNTLDSQIRSNVESIRQHTLNKSNPHFVTAQQIRALPLEFILDSSAVYFPFYQSLVSTRGIEPDGLQEATKTEYGLVTGDGLCATLLPEGGVAVTEGTTNIIDPKPEAWSGSDGGEVEKIDLYKMRVTNPTGGQWGRGQSSSFTVGNGETVTISGYIEGYAGYVGFQLRDITSDSPRINLVIDSVGYYHGTWTNDLGNDIECQLWLTVYGEYNPAGQQYIIADKIQAEKKPFATPFVEGTRPAGRLPYNLPTNLNADFTIQLKCFTEHDKHTSPAFLLDNDNHRLYLYKTKDHYVLIAVDNSENTRDIIYTPDSILGKHDFTVIRTGNVLSFYANGNLVGEMEYEWNPFSSKIWIGSRFGGTLHCNGTSFYNLLICPNAVTAETVATWHSLDVPFIDPFILPSQGVTQTPDDITIIETPGSTEDDITIIETSENTEVV